MFVTKKNISRRTVLRGMGVTVALPMLEAMLPAMTPLRTAASSPTRFACLEMVHGAAGSTTEGIAKNYWAPAAAGRDFDLTPTSLLPLQPFREYLTIVSNTDCRNAEAFELSEVGADHFRSSAVFLTQAKPKMTEGSDVYVATSIDQLYAKKFGQDTPLPSIQLGIENIDGAGGCVYGYACAYRDCITWASPSDALPVTRDPRVTFDQMFGAGGTPAERTARRKTDASILDWITHEVSRLKSNVGPSDRARLTEYLDDVREIERRIQKVEAYNSSGQSREVPDAPLGVPDSVDEHIKLMFDLQALGFMAGITNVSSFKMSKDATGRVFPESGIRAGFHGASHHGSRGEKLTEFWQINKYHVGLVAYFVDKLRKTPDGDGNLLDHSVVMYGSGMGDSNLHNHRRCPLFIVGHGNGKLKGNLHVKAEDGTPMANAQLDLLHKLGLEDMDTLGDSTGILAL
jgi:hypothetical protein